ncbi:MAG: transporter [Epsilonproteobacteria bacterium]|nr:transporter [Campylobacterota bacterium]
MKKKLLFLGLTSFLLAGGYKIPEQSINATALSSAYVANAYGADAAYYNPANMAFNQDKNFIELNAFFIHLNDVKFINQNGEVYYSRKEDYALPQFHFSSKDYNGFRFGFSIVYPGGLSKRWDDVIPEAGAKEFTLKTVEFNPTIAKKITDKIALGFGIRFVKSEGTANAIGLLPNGNGTYTPLYSEYLNGDSIDRGWNAAISFKDDSLSLAATYRSKVDLTLSGDASGYYLSDLILAQNPNAPLPAHSYIPFNTKAGVSIPLPATLNLAISKTFDKTTVEFVYDKTYWSTYNKLDFNFNDPAVEGIFGKPKPKLWKNSNTYRIGITHQCSNKLTAMLGYAYDESPIPDSTIDFSLPDSDKHIFSGGIKYKLSSNLTLGIAALITKQKTRNAKIYDPVTRTYTEGEFKKGGANILSMGLDYTF